MAYRVNNYHVFSVAGLSAEDTNEQAYTKIAAWLNSILSDVGTAEVFDVNDTLKAVRFVFKNVRAGICFGNLQTNSDYADKKYTGIIYGSDGGTLSVRSVYVGNCINNIETLYVFTAVSDYGAFIGFNSTEDELKDTSMYFLKCKDENNAAKNCCYGFNRTNSGNTYKNYLVYVGNESVYRVLNESMTTNLQKNLAVGNKTMLTKFYVPYTDCVPEGGYIVSGNIPNAQTVFEINGGKYVIGYNYDDRFVVALKLE